MAVSNPAGTARSFFSVAAVQAKFAMKSSCGDLLMVAGGLVCAVLGTGGTGAEGDWEYGGERAAFWDCQTMAGRSLKKD